MAGNKENQAPLADASKRRNLRAAYRGIGASLKERKEELTDIHSNAMQHTLEKLNQLHKQIEKPREAAVDAEVFGTLVESGLELSKKLNQAAQGRTLLDYVIALRSLYVGGDGRQEEGATNPLAFNWRLFAAKWSHMYRGAPGVNCMLGPMNAAPKVRQTVRQERQKRVIEELAQPGQVQNIEEQEKQVTDRIMDELYEALKLRGRLPLPELICNHNAFSQTVENLFSVAFLVKDQKVRMYLDDWYGQMVEILDKTDAKTAGKGGAFQEQSQFVFDFTMKDWETMKRVVKAKDCIMPHRGDHGSSTQTQIAVAGRKKARR